jgi:hypothetical protein
VKNLKVINVINNFIDNDVFYKFSKIIFDSDEFPWYFKKKNHPIKNYIQLKHTLIRNNNKEKTLCSPFVTLLLSEILKKLKAQKVYFAEITLRTRTDKIVELPPKINPDMNNQTLTAILFLNTNNGYTHVTGTDKIESIENRVIIFPTYTSYFQTTTSNENFRAVLTIEYDVN